MEKLYGLSIINPRNFFDLIQKYKIDNFHKISPAIPIEEYLKKNLTENERKELRFAPQVEVIKFENPLGKNFTSFRSVLKNGVLIFTLLPKKFLVICAEFRHGCERVMFTLPAGLIEERDTTPKERAKKEFQEETGITLQKLIPLNSEGIPIDARSLTRKNFFFLGIPKDPIEVKKPVLEESEFAQRFLVDINDWFKFMELGLVDDSSITGTFLALRKLNLTSY